MSDVYRSILQFVLRINYLRLRADSHRNKRGGIIPCPHFLLKCAALIDLDRAVASDADRIALQRPGCGPFKVDSVLIKTTAVARAFKLLLRFKPVGGAPKVRAHAL